MNQGCAWHSQGGHSYHVSPGCCLSDVCADCSNSTPTLLHIKHRGTSIFFYYTSFISQLHHLRLNLLHTLSICIFSSHFLKTNERIFQDDENGTKRLQTKNLECPVYRDLLHHNLLDQAVPLDGWIVS